MQHFLVTLDFGKQTFRLAPIAGRKLEGGFAVYGYGLSLSVDTNEPVTITNVVSGSPADQSGLEIGDLVLDVAGVDPLTVPPKERLGLVLSQSTGTARTFNVEHDGKQQKHSLVSADVFAAVP